MPPANDSDDMPRAPSEIIWTADECTIDALSRLVGEPVLTILCSSLRTHLTPGRPPRLRTEQVAIPVSGGLVTVGFPDWGDTEHFAINAFRIEARYRETAPEWAQQQYSEKKGGPIFPWTGISFRAPEFYKGPASAPIERVRVYRQEREERNADRGFTERVRFDKAILFEREEEETFLLFVDDSSIAGLMGISSDPDEIRRVWDGCTVSTEIGERRAEG